MGSARGPRGTDVGARYVCDIYPHIRRLDASSAQELEYCVPEGEWPEFREKAKAAYQAPSREVARMLRDVVVEEYDKRFPSAVESFLDDFEACIAHLRFPIAHRRVIRTTNLLERLFGEERRRMKIVANAFGERVSRDRCGRAHPGRGPEALRPLQSSINSR
jgi:hypothetical protein